MFKIENVYCDDKKLADLLHALAGLCVGHPYPVPMINAEKTDNGEIKQVTDGKMIDLFAVWLQDKNDGAEILPKHVQDFLKGHGRPVNSANYLLHRAMDVHLIRRGKGKGRNTNYFVTKAT